MTYALRYRPDTDLGRRYPEPTSATFPTREAAEAMRQACVNAASMEVVEVGER
jgi:hypothetical protein